MAQQRLVVLGFDAMDVELVRRWAAAGYLPSFRRLFESAAWTEYVNPPEHVSGTIWPSINTGLGPLRHGFNYASMFCADSYRTRMATASDLRGDPFWKWFAQSGRRISLADVPLAIPDERYGGKQVCGWGLHVSPWEASSVPSALLADLVARFGPHPGPDCRGYSTQTNSLLRFRSRLITGIERRTAILGSLIGSRDWDFFYGVYAEPHCAGHLMWHLEDESHPGHSREQLAVVGHALRDVYSACDHSLGGLLSSLDADTAVAVFFSQGMGPNHHAAHLFPGVLERFNRRWAGTSSSPERRASRGDSLDALWKTSVARLPAGFLARVKLLLPWSLRRWIAMTRQQNPSQMSRQPAFWLACDGVSLARINLIGREARGVVRPGEEYRYYLDALTAELSALTNADSGEPVVERMFRADQQVDPLAMGSGMDLIVWWRRSRPIRAIRSELFGTISGRFTEVPTGEHIRRGMFLVSHPRARPGRHAMEGMNALDIAATVCDLGGVQPEAPLEGTSRLRDLLAE